MCHQPVSSPRRGVSPHLGTWGSGAPEAVWHKRKAKVSPRHLISASPVAHLHGGWSHSTGIEELCCRGKREMIFLHQLIRRTQRGWLAHSPVPALLCLQRKNSHICESCLWSPKFGCRVTSSIPVSLTPQVHLQKRLSGGWFCIHSAWKKTAGKMSQVRILFSKNYSWGLDSAVLFLLQPASPVSTWEAVRTSGRSHQYLLSRLFGCFQHYCSQKEIKPIQELFVPKQPRIRGAQWCPSHLFLPFLSSPE